MKSRPLALLVCLLAVAASRAQVQFRSDVRLVNVAFSVQDQQGQLMTSLTQDDFEVVEDGVPQKIAFFARSLDVPLTLGLAVDASGSQGSFVKPHLKDLETFLKSVLGQNDRAFLLCFGNHLRVAKDFSSSAKDLAEGLREFHKGKNIDGLPEIGPRELRFAGTAFYDAIWHSINEKLAGEDGGRRALVIFSDGEDNSSAHHMMDAIEAAQTNDVILFCVRYTETRNGRLTARNKYGTSVMERIARETGGAEFDAREKGLAEGFRQIGEQLRSSYELSYHSTNPVSDDSFHKISIRLKAGSPAGLRVRAKTGYYASHGSD